MQRDGTAMPKDIRRDRREPALPKEPAHSANAVTSPTHPTGSTVSGMTGMTGTSVPGRTGVDAIDETGIPELERIKGVGDTLNGRFVLEECIGFGGMGTVYKALDLRKLEASDRKPYIAIKVLNVQFRGHPKSLIALQREARKAQSLAHPNIVAVYDFDRDGSIVYLTMEYLVGQPLGRMLRAPDFQPLSLTQALPIISGMAKALAYAHEHGFVHCDLKPANVFLTDRGDVKVIDFGIARVFQKPEEDLEATVFDAGTLGGLTPAYASPEMLEHRLPDPRDDVYALACITYELLTGRHPFDRMAATQARGTGMKASKPKKLGYWQWRVLRSALSFERETRTPSVMKFLEGLRRDHRAWFQIAIVTLGLAVAGLGVFGVRHYRSQQPTAVAADVAPVIDGANSPSPLAPVLPGKLSEQGTTTVPDAASGPPAIAMAAVTPVIGRVPCAALNASARGHTLDITGFMTSEYGMQRLRSLLSKIPGVASLNVDVHEVNPKSCGIIRLLGPYWQRSRTAGASIRTRAPSALLTEGDSLVIDLITPGYGTWAHVDYFALDGDVAHLMPSLRARNNQAPPFHTATIGGLGEWVISRPFGSEMIVLTTTPVPLFNTLRPEHETSTEYLRAMKKQLRDIHLKYGADKISVEFLKINTREKNIKLQD